MQTAGVNDLGDTQPLFAGLWLHHQGFGQTPSHLIRSLDDPGRGLPHIASYQTLVDDEAIEQCLSVITVTYITESFPYTTCTLRCWESQSR